MFSMTRSLPFRDACLLKGFIYHKGASRWLGRLHRNVSGTLEWINFLCFAKLIMTESQSRVNPYISGLIPTICQWYSGPFQCDTLQLSSPTYMLLWSYQFSENMKKITLSHLPVFTFSPELYPS